MARQQSIEAWITADKETAQRKVFNTILELPGITRQEIADVLEWPINRVCPRVLELIDRNLICETGEYQVMNFANKTTRRAKLKVAKN